MSSFSPRSRRIDAARLIVAATVAVCAAAPVGTIAAQGPIQRADALLQAGRVMAAESLYYAAVSLTPRNPQARHALGRYLAARGRWKIGVTLIEEARFFGFDAHDAAESLAPLYATLHDYRSLAALPRTPLTAAERQRVIFLRDNPPAVAGADSAVVRLHAGSGTAIARVAVTIAGEEVIAAIDPTVRGLVLDTTWMARPGIRRFPASANGDARKLPAVALEMRIGDLRMHNVPVRFGAASGAVIGLDVIDELTPTFDPAAEMLIVRRAKRVPPGRGEQLVTLDLPTGWFVANGVQLLPLHGPEAGTLLAGRRWTLHARRGVLTLER